MRYSQAFIPTLKEVPADAQVASHIYLVRGGFIRKLSAGIYNFLPIGWRVIHKIESIIREEMNRAGAQEVLMPAAIPAELWQETGRWFKYGPELLRFKDRKGGEFCFGPTHEEVITDMVRREIKSYRQLPVNLYQIQGKFRDEMRPRAGLMRGREFIMKDAYSFDVSVEAALRSYDGMYEAYKRIFRRCGLDFRPVEADTGAIGGSRSHEFQVLAESGEDSIVACDRCDYAANVEQAELRAPVEPGVSGGGERQRVDTPGKKTIDDVAAFLKVEPKKLIKTLLYMADDKPVAALVRGDRTLNEIAFKKVLGATELYLMREDQVHGQTGSIPGFAGPVGLAVPVYADRELEGATGAVVGGNEKGVHLTGVDLARDATITAYVSLRVAEAGDRCARCDGGHYRAFRGIEVGHVFFLGTVYSAKMSCSFLDESGGEKPMEMGCYGIGVTRVMAAAIEQNHDADGIVWPMAIAPFEVALLTLQKDEAVSQAAEGLYQALRERGVEVLFDDRDERPGAKFKDADLIGVPLRIAVGGRSLKEGVVEVKWRRDKEPSKVPVGEAAARVVELVLAERGKLGA
jgi:prolyl-tRNA synthetase